MLKNHLLSFILSGIAFFFCFHIECNHLGFQVFCQPRDKAQHVYKQHFQGYSAAVNATSFIQSPAQISEAERKRKALKRIYSAEIGVREVNAENRGQKVEEYLNYTGLTAGYAWCASFVCWALGKADIRNPKSAWCPDLFPASKIIWQRGKKLQTSKQKARFYSNGAKLQITEPTSGDVFGIWLPGQNRIAHVGFVDQWQENYVITVEGNTNDKGSAEGDGVYRRRRLQNSLYQIACYINN